MKDEVSSNQTDETCPQCPAPARWMVVDDNKNLLELFAFLLQEISHAEIWRFNSPAEALAAFTDAPGFFQFVVTDLDMPGMNGKELCRRLHELAPGLKILLTTGSTYTSDEDARQSGFCGLLPKPFLSGALERTLEAAGVVAAIPHAELRSS